jgi:hypothetical protein
MSDQTLKPCPFCGKHVDQRRKGRTQRLDRGIECGHCVATGPWRDLREADWNTRPIEDALRARAEAAEAALATARAEGAAAERAAVVALLHAQLAYAAPRGWPEAVEMLEECIEDIEAGAHVRPVEGA